MTLADRLTDGVVVLRPPTSTDVPDFIDPTIERSPADGHHT
jgi:hypothetical protein